MNPLSTPDMDKQSGTWQGSDMNAPSPSRCRNFPCPRAGHPDENRTRHKVLPPLAGKTSGRCARAPAGKASERWPPRRSWVWSARARAGRGGGSRCRSDGGGGACRSSGTGHAGPAGRGPRLQGFEGDVLILLLADVPSRSRPRRLRGCARIGSLHEGEIAPAVRWCSAFPAGGYRRLWTDPSRPRGGVESRRWSEPIRNATVEERAVTLLPISGLESGAAAAPDLWPPAQRVAATPMRPANI